MLLLLPKSGMAFSANMFAFWHSNTKAPTDPCASAAEPEKCHYNQAVNLLAHMTNVPSASKVPLTSSLSERIGMVMPETVSTLAPAMDSKAIPGSIGFLKTTQAPATKDTGKQHQDQLDPAVKEEQSVALLMALGALEGEELPAQSLEKATVQLEDELNKMQPGALAAFRARRLAEAMNHHGPPRLAEKRASEALAALEQVQWSRNSAVPDVIRDLQSKEKSKSFSLVQGDADAQSSAQLWIVFIFVLSLLMIDKLANEVAMVPQHVEHHGYGAMGHAPVRH